MSFSILCLTYKRVRLLEECLFSVLNQTHQDFEMIIINDCPDQRLIFDDPKIKIFNLNNRFNTLGDKRNFAIQQATKEYIVSLDDDDFYLPNYLSVLKDMIAGFDWISSQRVLYYYDNRNIKVSPVGLKSNFVYRRDVLQNKIIYPSINYDEVSPFYSRIIRRGHGQYKAMKLSDVGYVYRKEMENRKYSMVDLKNKTIEEQSDVVNNIQSDEVGEIILNPRWNTDYISIINKYADYYVPRKPLRLGESKINPGTIPTVETKSPIISENDWKKVKFSWENAIKFVKAAKSRGLIATTVDAIGISNNIGDRVFDEDYQQRKISCFGDKEKNIQPCTRLKHVENKGYFCGGCGCGSKDLARLDSDSPDEYTKLHYPQLECPLKKRGFSNYSVPISIIMPVLNDNEEANLTIKSIYETSPDNVEVIVIDDASDNPVAVDDKRVRLFRFDERKGAGQSRHFGALNATSKHLLFIDSHMRFDPDWFDNAIKRISDSPKTLWCGICLGLNETNMDITKPMGKYMGADFVLYRDKNNTIFDGVWKSEIKDKDDYEISCVMGACYFMHKDWYFYIRGLESTMMWGSEEPILSLKTWLAGGEVRLMKSVKLGHKFRDVAPYITNISHIHYNKLAYMFMMLPSDLYETLKDKFHKDGNLNEALKLVEQNKVKLEEEKEYYKSIFQKDVYWFCDKFQISIPKYSMQ